MPAAAASTCWRAGTGAGWYADGRAFDHYNGWALHLYPVLDAHLADAPLADAHLADAPLADAHLADAPLADAHLADAPLADAHRADAPLAEHTAPVAPHGARLREHLDSLSLPFGADGAPLHFGRSLTYRFAAASAVALGAVTGPTPLTPGTSRRLLSGSLRYFLDPGAVDGDGLLTLGWHGRHEATLQPYSWPASPYWASKAFVGLLAPAGHPLWSAAEEPAPCDGPDRVVALPAPGLLLQTTRADGIVRLHNHGSDHVGPGEAEQAADEDPLYARQAYSTRTGPTARSNAPDNHLWVEVSAVRSARRRIHPLGAGQGDGWGWAASWHLPVFGRGAATMPGLRVASVTVARGPYELRVHRVLGAPAGSRVHQTGWATGPAEPLVSALHPLHGWTGGDEVRAPADTAFTSWARMPRLSAEADGEEGTTLYACLAVLGAAAGTAPLSGAVTEVNAGAGTVEVRWAADRSLTRIAFAPLAATAVNVNGSAVDRNKVSGTGSRAGGIYNNNGIYDLTDSSVQFNVAPDAPAPGGIWTNVAITAVTNTTIANNTPTNCIYSPAPVTSCID